MTPETVSTLLAPVDAPSLVGLRDHWRWLVGDNLSPRGITTIGDWLFLDDSGRVYRLDTIEATVDRIAVDLPELGRMVRSPDFRDEMFLEGLVIAGLRGRQLPRNACVGFRVPPILGGRFEQSNLEIVSVGSYQLWTARLHEALRKVPEGRQILGVDVDDEGIVTVRWK